MSEKTEKALKEVFKEYLLAEGLESGSLTEAKTKKKFARGRKIWRAFKKNFGIKLNPWLKKNKWKLALYSDMGVEFYMRQLDEYSYEDWKILDPLAYAEAAMLWSWLGNLPMGDYGYLHTDEDGDPYPPWKENPQLREIGINRIVKAISDEQACKAQIGKQADPKHLARCEQLFRKKILDAEADRDNEMRADEQRRRSQGGAPAPGKYNENNPAYKAAFKPDDPVYIRAEELIRKNGAGEPLTDDELDDLCTYIYDVGAPECL